MRVNIIYVCCRHGGVLLDAVALIPSARGSLRNGRERHSRDADIFKHPQPESRELETDYLPGLRRKVLGNGLSQGDIKSYAGYPDNVFVVRDDAISEREVNKHGKHNTDIGMCYWFSRDTSRNFIRRSFE
jgi:hypothetical protein